MLERFAIAAAADQFANGIEMGACELLLEVQIQLQTRHAERVGQQQFDLQAGVVHTFPAQKIGAALNDFQDRHHARLGAVDESTRFAFQNHSPTILPQPP